MERTITTKASLTVTDPFALAHDYEGEVLKLVRREYEGLCRNGIFYVKILELVAYSAPVVQTYIFTMPTQIAVQFTADVREFNRGQVLSLVKVTRVIGMGGDAGGSISVQGEYRGAAVSFESQRTEGLRSGLLVAARCVGCNLMPRKSVVNILATLYARQRPIVVRHTGVGVTWKPEYDAVVALLYELPEEAPLERASGVALLAGGRFYATDEPVVEVVEGWPALVTRMLEEARLLLESHAAAVADADSMAAWRAYSA